MNSQLLGTDQPYSIFLPPSYSKESSRRYPVIYFLHGLNNDHTSWTVDRYGNLQNKVEEMILARKLPEIIMVHPRADNSFYCNYADGSKRYEDFVTQELVNYIESGYRAKRGRENRAIGGTSMGGIRRAEDRDEVSRSLCGHGRAFAHYFSRQEPPGCSR